MIKLEALRVRRRCGPSTRGISHRTRDPGDRGEEPPDYGSPVFQRGRGVGKLTSPSAGRSPTVDKLIAMAQIEVELT